MPYKDPQRQRQAQRESQKRRYHASSKLRDYAAVYQRKTRSAKKMKAAQDAKHKNSLRAFLSKETCVLPVSQPKKVEASVPYLGKFKPNCI